MNKQTPAKPEDPPAQGVSQNQSFQSLPPVPSNSSDVDMTEDTGTNNTSQKNKVEDMELEEDDDVQVDLTKNISNSKAKTKKAKPRAKKAKVAEKTGEQPCILVLDSLYNANTSSSIFKKIRTYLGQEYAAKKGVEFSFTNSNLPGYCPKVPCQLNEYDCGVFILRYAERFCLDPPRNFSKKALNEEVCNDAI